MSDVWAILTPILQPAVVIGGVALLFRVLVTDRIKGLERERDEYKAAWKEAVQSRRRVRRELEVEERGAPSVPPPPPDDYEEETGVYAAIAREDRVWERERAERRQPLPRIEIPDLLPEREEQRLERYVSGDPLSTPPEPVQPVRKRMPSRRD